MVHEIAGNGVGISGELGSRKRLAKSRKALRYAWQAHALPTELIPLVRLNMVVLAVIFIVLTIFIA